ncbi:sulfurtransferase [Arenimonas sp. GDDSR-1]|uniref:sulfurtransferase n=1 Tax=Arenimonas sp. GDDSR-1 TaxID=2950125 RepID=UPI0026268237|nr:sulfurtransferase [Arenimonas sp. GDDSR-1]
MSDILNIAAYRFVTIVDVDAVAVRVKALCEQLELKGTVLVSPEGLNVFLAGSDPAIRGFLEALQADVRFRDIGVKYSRSSFVPFKRLRVKRKREIITYRDERLAPENGRAPSVTPETLAHWLDRGCDDAGREVVLLDTRNAEEVVYGTFAGALTFPIAKFTELPEAVESQKEALAGKTVVSFCTGGIRCEKSVLRMQADGFSDCYQLEGGILGYFEKMGGKHYQGRCFVFDDRIALDPNLDPLIETPGF